MNSDGAADDTLPLDSLPDGTLSASLKRTADTALESQQPAPKKPKVSRQPSSYSFEAGDKVAEILGARMIDGVLHLYVNWAESDACSFVVAETCNQRIPQKVISFYESRVKFIKSATLSTIQ
eukprot:TRINITY_DN9691_c0_g1_i1.p1 TRINITY_DN9691_c0_g1~~TRINITY_DN9691_c0_g1_i1.p1  ORF type:complete len:134 (+),score=30.74 TRINITY_DN9691_c0_g1_i1:38-403(+)